MGFIFLSHSSRDDAAASALLDWLREEGHEAVFLDHDVNGITGGEPWEERLYTELRRCRALIALISPDWIASPWCVAEADHAQALRKPVLPLRIALIDPAQYAARAPPVLRRVQSINWDHSEEARDRLRRGLLTAGLDPRNSFILGKDRPPYPGLAAFQREDAAVYFGREQEVTDLLAMLRECRAPNRPRLVLVQGASGTGKSSLLRAGVLPRLERDPENWLVVPPFRPHRDPFQGLTYVLAASGAPPGEPPPSSSLPDPADQAAWTAAWAKWIVNTATGLRRRASCPEATVLLSVDQLEEALAGSGGGLGDWFLLALREALTAADHRLLVVATLRADFTGTLQRHSALREPAAVSGEILATRAFQLGPLPRAAFHAVIEGPAALAGLELEPGLVSRIVDEARTDDALPLLAFALRELWDRHGKADLKLTSAEYDSFGGLEAAVGDRAEQIIAAVKPSIEELEAFRTTLVFSMAELSAEGRILRRRLPWAKVPEAARRLVEEFARARLLVIDETAVEVVHEALFRRWEPLRDRIDKAKEELGIQRRAREAAEEWDHAGRPGGSLWRPPDLDLLRRYAVRNASTLEPVQTAFLDASERHESLIWWVTRGAIGLIILLAIGAGVFGWESQKQAWRAEEQRNQALLTQSRLLADHANQRIRESDAGTAMLLALEALPDQRGGRERPYMPEAGAALSSARQILQERLVLGHEGAVWRAVFSPDGARVLTASEDSTARIWDAETGREMRVLQGHQGAVRSAVFSPDGARILTASEDNTARIWDAETGREMRVLRGHKKWLSSAVFSPDGARVLTASEDNTARIWDAETGRELTVLWGHQGAVWSAVFSPDGARVLTASDDTTARIWDAETGRELTVLWGHQDRVSSAVFSSDGARILTASADKTARIWDAETGREMRVLRGHKKWLSSAVFSPDSARVLTASADTTARIWDAQTGRELTVLQGHEKWLSSAVFSPDGARVLTASADTTARIWDAQTGREPTVLQGHQDKVSSAVFSPDGARVLTASADNTARIWDAETGRELTVLQGHQGAVRSAVFSPDGTRVLTASEDNTARIWDAETGREVRVLRGHKSLVWRAVFSPDGARVLTASEDNTARIWDAQTGREPTVLQGHQDKVSSAVFSPDGARVLTASDDTTARIWDAQTGRELTVLWGHKSWLSSAVFSPDGTRVLTASEDNTARIWDAETGRELTVLRRHQDKVWRAVFSPDGARVLTASEDNTARIWDAETGREVRVLRGHKSLVWRAVFSPDGARVLTASEDNTARIWDAQTGRELTVLWGHQDKVWRAVFSSDGARILTASDDKTARIWPVSSTPQALVEDAKAVEDTKARVPRCLTHEQRTEAFLDPEPLAWCIEREKWPNHTQDWKDWLRYKREKANPPLPDMPEWTLWLKARITR